MGIKNAVDDGKPYYDDLYLDAALWADGRMVVLDEDESVLGGFLCFD